MAGDEKASRLPRLLKNTRMTLKRYIFAFFSSLFRRLPPDATKTGQVKISGLLLFPIACHCILRVHLRFPPQPRARVLPRFPRLQRRIQEVGIV